MNVPGSEHNWSRMRCIRLADVADLAQIDLFTAARVKFDNFSYGD